MEPQNQISKKALKVWRIIGVIECSITWVITIAVLILTVLFDWPLLDCWNIGCNCSCPTLFLDLFIPFS